MLEAVRKNRAKVEDQNEKLEKLKLEREAQIEAINLKIEDKEMDVSKAENVLSQIEQSINEIVQTALC